MLLVDASDRPVYLEQNATVPPPSPFAGQIQSIYSFSEFAEGATYPGWASFKLSDFTSPARCPLAGTSDPPPVDQDMFLFHPANNFNITKQAAAAARSRRAMLAAQLASENPKQAKL